MAEQSPHYKVEAKTGGQKSPRPILRRATLTRESVPKVEQEEVLHYRGTPIDEAAKGCNWLDLIMRASKSARKKNEYTLPGIIQALGDMKEFAIGTYTPDEYETAHTRLCKGSNFSIKLCEVMTQNDSLDAYEVDLNSPSSYSQSTYRQR